MLSAAGATIGYDPHGPDVVMASAFDEATRLFLNAAERCLASERREKELQQRLTAADERRDVLVGLLRDMRKGDHAMISSFYGRIDAALKPAEVSDKSCEFCKGWGFRANSETGADEGCGACNGTGSTPSEDQP